MRSTERIYRRFRARVDSIRVEAMHAAGRLTAGSRALPDFLILGVQKGGTTSLHWCLRQHPQLRMGLRKEVHFFDLNYSRGLGWYRAFFPFQRPGHMTGEASPYYFHHPLVPARIRQDLPDAKFILLFRNPVARAYSHYQMIRGLRSADRETAPSFEEAVRREAARLEGEVEKMRADPTYYSVAHFRYGYLARSRYHEQLARWLKYFPLERFLFIKSEDFFLQPREQLARVYEFLGLPAVLPRTLTPRMVGDYPPVRPETAEKLEEILGEDNRKLSELLGENFSWSRGKKDRA